MAVSVGGTASGPEWEQPRAMAPGHGPLPLRGRLLGWAVARRASKEGPWKTARDLGVSEGAVAECQRREQARRAAEASEWRRAHGAANRAQRMTTGH